MQPAFSSTRQAAGFAILLLVVLLLPALLGKTQLPPRVETYTAMPLNLGAMPFVKQQIFDETGDIDIAFVGSSHMWTAVHPPHIRAALEKKLGRPAKVMTLGWNWPGFDGVYFISKDLLARRKVRLMIISEEYSPDAEIPHMAATRWFRVGDDWADLAGLPWRWQTAYYADSLRGMPRNLLSLVRTNHTVRWTPAHSDWERSFNGANSDEHLGSLSVLYGYGTEKINNPNYLAFTPPRDVPPGETLVYSPETKDRFRFTGPATPEQHLFFAKKIAELARAHGVKLVWLHIPKAEELRAPAVPERECWPDVLPGTTLLGLPPASLTAGLTDEEVLKLFYNNAHLNKNGQEFFTRAITPALLEFYATQIRH